MMADVKPEEVEPEMGDCEAPPATDVFQKLQAYFDTVPCWQELSGAS